MNEREIKNILEQYKDNEQLIQNIEERIDRLEARIMSVTTPPLSPLPGGGIKIGIDDYIIEKEKLKEKINATKELLKKAEYLIGLVDNPSQQLILRLRYIDGLNWSKVAKKVYYCKDSCIRISKTAISNIAAKCRCQVC